MYVKPDNVVGFTVKVGGGTADTEPLQLTFTVDAPPPEFVIISPL